MKCYLCGMNAQPLSDSAAGQVVQCPDCGEYRVSQEVLRELNERQFDYLPMREALHRQRQTQASVLADINSLNAIWRQPT
ncbi:hypothetical protein [Pseudomonas typographi]|uniref:Uncharacterized protein n=1 Tax=Pseudomonas typographi TaxID=2715964 RepID=A0ABR7Z0V8_9PSED|nr:hypothetical protein [Pseudomonas typographi]MBD1552272.1 hypothetical protein [Pseudomonas typographi]MBD1587392.1 hypothetical protein [Pseudomonas typographi]MBD1599113.1 hypothetical protein [Pseudomonas typographi]